MSSVQLSCCTRDSNRRRTWRQDSALRPARSRTNACQPSPRTHSTLRGTYRQAALVDQLPVGIDDSLHRTLRQTLDLPVDDLDRSVEQGVLGGLFEDQIERLSEVLEICLRKAFWKKE